MSASLSKQLHDLLRFNDLTEIVDIGANPIEGDAPYRELLAEGLCNVTAIEPQSETLAELNSTKSANETYLPYAIGDGSCKTLNICRHSGWTSTLTPSKTSLDVFSAYKTNATVINTTQLETRRLDDLSEIARIDFLKIDIQGGELDAFRHARKKLSKTVMLQTEVSFVNLYDNQPSFGEVDLELRGQGFVPHHIWGVKKGIISPFVLNNDPWQTLNQLLEADIVYVKDFRDLAGLSDDQLRHLSLIAQACYGSYDLSYRCVLTLEERRAITAGSARRYISLVNNLLRQRASCS